MKCKFYHPERANQSQLPVADELRALRDRAKNLSPKPSLQDAHLCPAAFQPEHRYDSSTPPPLSGEESHRASPSEPFAYQRDSSSPRNQPKTSLHQYSSSDIDEALSSMDSSMSRIYIQDVPHGLDSPSRSYSSGVASYGPSHDDCSLSGEYGGNRGGYFPQYNSPVCKCCHQQARIPPHHYHPGAWCSCPAAPPQKANYSSHLCEEQYYRQPSNRHPNSLPTDPWVQGSHSNARVKRPSSEQRKDLRTQLSTLFPQSTVEQVMNAYPHISDMSELISLIQSYRRSHMSLGMTKTFY